MDRKQIIAVDFDGTLCFSTWPDTGEPNQPLIDYLKIHKKAGDKLILWTCRSGVILDKALSWCREVAKGYCEEACKAVIKQIFGEGLSVDHKRILPGLGSEICQKIC